MSASVTFEPAAPDGVARVVLANPGKLNAIDVAMWRELRTLFLHMQSLPVDAAPRAVIVCGAASRFGAPIAKLGFPMAPGELAVLARVASPAALRELLLEARLFDAQRALQLGLVHAVVADADVAAHALQRAQAMAALPAHAARINKQTLRQLAAGGPSGEQRRAHFAYAPHAAHVEGVTAFIEKRTPRFHAD